MSPPYLTRSSLGVHESPDWYKLPHWVAARSFVSSLSPDAPFLLIQRLKSWPTFLHLREASLGFRGGTRTPAAFISELKRFWAFSPKLGELWQTVYFQLGTAFQSIWATELDLPWTQTLVQSPEHSKIRSRPACLPRTKQPQARSQNQPQKNRAYRSPAQQPLLLRSI